MKIFNFNKNKETKKGRNMSFSVPFLTLPSKYNVSKPFLSLFRVSDGYEYFGADNIYSNLLEQYYYLEPTHKACIDLKVGTAFSRYEIKGLNEINTKAFELKNDLYATIERLFYNMVIHENFCIRVQKSKNSDLPKISVIDSGMVRFNQNKDFAFISDDWSTRRNIYKLPINDFDSDDFIFLFQRQGISMTTYNLPSYNSILNLLEQSQEISYLKVSAIKNSTYPNIVVSLPYLIETKEESEELKEALTGSKGASNAGQYIVLTGDGRENLPEITQINPSNTAMDGMFAHSELSIKNNILMAHNVPQQLLLSTPGKLGGSQEVKELYSIFVETVTSKITATVNQQLNFLFKEIGSKIEIEIFDLDYKAMFSDDDEVEDQDQDQDNNLQEVKKDNKNKKED